MELSANMFKIPSSDEEKAMREVASKEPVLSASRSLSGSNDAQDHNSSKLAYWRMCKLFFCFIGLQGSYLLWGYSQERIMTIKYEGGMFQSSQFCVLANRVFAMIISALIITFRTGTVSDRIGRAPFYYFAPASLSNTISSWAQYEALKFVSFPTQVLSKSCKIIPVMLAGMIVNNKSYTMADGFEAALITLGVFMFMFSQTNSVSEKKDSIYGVSLIAIYLSFDSLTSQWQSKVYKQFEVDPYQMMYGSNVWSILLTLATIVPSGELWQALQFIFSDSLAIYHVMLLSITSAIGQLFIFYTIKEFGPVIFTIIMTTRQIFALILSCLIFSHTMKLESYGSALFVFLVVGVRLFRNNGKD